MIHQTPLVMTIVTLLWGVEGAPSATRTPVPSLNERADFVVWSENFDDGDLNDWTIENPMAGNNAVTLALSNAEYHSSSYSLRVHGPVQDYYGGMATGPEFLCSMELRHTIRFWFRHTSFHWYYLVLFGPVNVVLDYESFQLQYWPRSGEHTTFGREDWYAFCPADSWTEVRIEVDPQNLRYELFLNDTSMGVADYDAGYDSDARGFRFIETGGDAPAEADYISNGYYDDISISISVSPGDLNGDDLRNSLDIQGFVQELIKPDGLQRLCTADLDGNRVVDIDDIDDFVNALLQV